MPFGVKINCSQCQKSESLFWHNSDAGKLCNDCYELTLNKEETLATEENDPNSKSNTEVEGNVRNARRTTRAVRTRNKLNNAPPKQGKGRRTLFKGKPTKAPSAVATVVTSDYVYYKGSYLQVGDIVRLQDIDGGYYYAQIRGLLTDQYCEKSAVITWLLPTQASPPPEDGFDPATYILGPEEDLPRKLECMEFVSHAPSDYYKASGPYPGVDTGKADHYQNKNFIWTSIGNSRTTETLESQ